MNNITNSITKINNVGNSGLRSVASNLLSAECELSSPWGHQTGPWSETYRRFNGVFMS